MLDDGKPRWFRKRRGRLVVSEGLGIVARACVQIAECLVDLLRPRMSQGDGGLVVGHGLGER